jgi:hypothetical protein
MATMNACLLQRRSQLRYGSLADDNLQRSGRATAYQSEINGAPDAFGSEKQHDFPHALDRLSIPGRDDITDENSRTRGRSVRVDAHDQIAALAGRSLRPIGRAFPLHGLKASAEITTKDMSSC